MKNTSHQKPIRKDKQSKKPNTASMLNSLEHQVVVSAPKRQRRTKLKQKNSRANKIFVVIVAITILCVVGFFAVMSSIATQADKQRFVELKKTTDNLYYQLSSVTPDDVTWSHENHCAYLFTKTTGGWTCSVLLSTEISPKPDSVKEITHSFFDVIDSSGELVQIESPSSEYDYPNTISEGGYMKVIYETKLGDIRCDAKSGLPASDSDRYINGNIRISLLCSGGAQKSWYPNSEAIKDESLRPGVNAWRSIK